MATHEQAPTAAKGCRHFLVLTLKPGRDQIGLWAVCIRCSRRWFLGTEAEIREALERLGVAS